VAPVFNDEGNRKLYLPEGRWYDFFGELQPVQGAEKSSARPFRSIASPSTCAQAR